MKIKVNGEEKKIELDQENALLSSALNLMGYKPNTIVVELNNLIINSIQLREVKLKDGDNLEIVSIVGGGQNIIFLNIKNLHNFLSLSLKYSTNFF